MIPLDLGLAGTLVIAGAGAGASLLGRNPRLATRLAVVGCLLGAALGCGAAVLTLAGFGASQLSAGWGMPNGVFLLGLDAASAYFMLPLFVLGALGAIYGRSYLGARALPAGAFNLLIAAIALVLLARHALVFLTAWELMTLLAFLLITFEHGDAEVRRAGWVYLIASHVAFLALWALFVGLATRADGALDFAAFEHAWRASEGGAVGGILVLGLIGFGIKAGIAGLHVWLPEAHAAAPSHVSAFMSGVQIKVGIYGLLRLTLLVSPEPWFGITLMLLGGGGALFGIALGVYQRDLKRLLAYSSIENIGIILLALGLGFWARDRGDPRVAALAFAGGLLHIWNHAAIKGLLFLGAGSVLHATGTKDIERLGGLARLMPWTGRALIFGAVAIAGLPPLNGLAGEWLLYRAFAEVGLHETSPANLAAAGAAAALALVGGLATLCFVRLVGVVLLGAPRGEAAARAHESPRAMTLPMAVLAAACLASTFGSPLLVSAQSALLEQLGAASQPEIAAAASFGVPLVIANAALLGAIVLASLWLAGRVSKAEIADTWGCGYVAPSARMQYTGRAFAELFTSRVLPRWLRPSLRASLPEGRFPASAAFASELGDPFTRRVYEPFLTSWGNRLARLRFLQQGKVHIYLLYMVATTVGALAWLAAREGLVR